MDVLSTMQQSAVAIWVLQTYARNTERSGSYSSSVIDLSICKQLISTVLLGVSPNIISDRIMDVEMQYGILHIQER